jgi:bis(5'-nucleosyl)-tetraphosphatase (symmetrical)
MYGNHPDAWDEGLKGLDRWRVVVNALTRLRFCSAQGQMEFDTKEGSGHAPAGFMPWFEVPGRQTADVDIAFGHWSTLGPVSTARVWALDAGCVWGGQLSLLRLEANGQHERIAVDCPQSQQPGR